MMKIFPLNCAFIPEKLDNDRLIFYAYIAANLRAKGQGRAAGEAEFRRRVEAKER
jgi:hypothetical protein